MILDGHIHTGKFDVNMTGFKERLKTAGVDGGIILSLDPDSFSFSGSANPAGKRLENVLSVTKNEQNLYPFFWIDPMEEDALDQVKMAVDSGIAGFKVICNRFYPGDVRPMEVFSAIAEHKKPILFHSGILWDGQPSSIYNRPAGFEALLDIKGLKFCLAHISWPWVDECIAVYGKFLNAYSMRPEAIAEMFIDLTPGTPVIYREDALKKLFTVGYDIENNLIFGSDSLTDNYNSNWIAEWIKRDNEIYGKLGLQAEVLRKVYSGNLLRFIGVTSNTISKRALKVAE